VLLVTYYKLICSVLRTDRLACLRHAASVHPEPGSNSQKESSILKLYRIYTGYQVFRIPGYQEEPDCPVTRLPNYLTLGTTFQNSRFCWQNRSPPKIALQVVYE